MAAALLDRDGAIIDANWLFASLCQRTELELSATAFYDLLAEDYRDVARVRFDRLLSSTSGDADHFRLRLGLADDRWVDLSVTALGPPPVASSVLVFVVAIGDVRVRFETAMTRLHAKPRQTRTPPPSSADSAVDGVPGDPAPRPLVDVIAAASHELRQPLQSIIGWVRIARALGVDGSQISRALVSIERNAQYMNGIADDLLACTPYVRRTVRSPEPVDLGRLVDESMESLRPSADAASVALGASVPAEPVMVRADRSGLQHVMINLLANAIRATPAQGAVHVQVDRSARLARLEVSDTGHGIAQEELADLFLPFGPRHPTSRGLGVGLAIVREWVELFGGTIRAESNGEHRGARFIVTLPVDDAQP